MIAGGKREIDLAHQLVGEAEAIGRLRVSGAGLIADRGMEIDGAGGAGDRVQSPGRLQSPLRCWRGRRCRSRCRRTSIRPRRCRGAAKARLRPRARARRSRRRGECEGGRHGRTSKFGRKRPASAPRGTGNLAGTRAVAPAALPVAPVRIRRAIVALPSWPRRHFNDPARRQARAHPRRRLPAHGFHHRRRQGPRHGAWAACGRPGAGRGWRAAAVGHPGGISRFDRGDRQTGCRRHHADVGQQPGAARRSATPSPAPGSSPRSAPTTRPTSGAIAAGPIITRLRGRSAPPRSRTSGR